MSGPAVETPEDEESVEDEEPDEDEELDDPVAPQVPEESVEDVVGLVVLVVCFAVVCAPPDAVVAAELVASTAIAPASPTNAATLAPAAACRAR